MSTIAQEVKARKLKKHSKFPTRVFSRCNRCGRQRSFIRYFGLCRICMRELASKGELPGVRKASW